MPQYKRSRPLLTTIFILISYIIYLHLSGTWDPSTQQTKSKHEEPTPKTPRIAIITMNTRETSYDTLSLSNKFSYANKHAYDLKVDFEGAGVWHKMNMFEDAIKLDRYDWIWWIDFDTLITNKTIKLEDIIEKSIHMHADPDSVDLILTADCFPLNAGSMIWRASPRLHSFIKLIRKCGERDPSNPDARQFSEQDCIRDLVGVNNNDKEHPFVAEEWAKRTQFIPQWKINAFPDEISCWDKDRRGWKEGDFVIHFAGAWAHMKDTNDPTGFLMQKYRHYIID